MSSVSPHSIVDTLVALYCREGSPFHGADRELIRVRLEWEWRSGQWVMLTGPSLLWGWMSWYRTDDEGLAYLRDLRGDELVWTGKLIPLTVGSHIYVPTAVVAPWAPSITYRRLYESTKAANRDAHDISGHLTKRDGRMIFHRRRLH